MSQRVQAAALEEINLAKEDKDNDAYIELCGVNNEQNKLPSTKKIVFDGAKEMYLSAPMDVQDAHKPSSTVDGEQKAIINTNILDFDAKTKKISTGVLVSQREPSKKSHRKNISVSMMRQQGSKITSGSEAMQEKNASLQHVANPAIGDIVWVKLETANGFIWPAKVVDPTKEVPESILNASNPFRLCVMFYGATSREEVDCVSVFNEGTEH